MNRLAQWQHDLAATIDGRPAIDVALAASSVPGVGVSPPSRIFTASSITRLVTKWSK